MSGSKQGSLAQVMMVVALAAATLALLRVVPWDVVIYPTIWVLLGAIDFVIFWKLILKRTLGAFHYTFLIVFIVAFIVAANLVATERFRPLGLLVRCWQQLSGAHINVISAGFLEIGEFWLACLLTFILACAIGSVASWLEKRNAWDIAAILRGCSRDWGSRLYWRRLATPHGALRNRLPSCSASGSSWWFVSFWAPGWDARGSSRASPTLSIPVLTLGFRRSHRRADDGGHRPVFVVVMESFWMPHEMACNACLRVPCLRVPFYQGLSSISSMIIMSGGASAGNATKRHKTTKFR